MMHRIVSATVTLVAIVLLEAVSAQSQQPTAAQLDSIYPDLTLDAEELVFRAWAQAPERRCRSGASFLRERGLSASSFVWRIGWHDGDLTWDRGDGPMKPPYTDRTWVDLGDLPIWMELTLWPPRPQTVREVREEIDNELIPGLERLYATEGKGAEFYVVPWSRLCR